MQYYSWHKNHRDTWNYRQINKKKNQKESGCRPVLERENPIPIFNTRARAQRDPEVYTVATRIIKISMTF